jgi:hypothetical protein
MASDHSLSIPALPPFLPDDDPLSALGLDFSLDQLGDGELPFPKKEEPIDEVLFPGTLDHDAFDDGWIGEDVVPFISEEAWMGTEGLMTALLGQDQSLSGVTLNDDVFMVANKESIASLAQVLTSPVSSQDIADIKNVDVTAMTLDEPEAETADTYRWRGDCGLLDRLAYRDSQSIPTGWKDTTMDPLKIKQSQSSSYRLEGLRPDSIEWSVNAIDSDSNREPRTAKVQKSSTGSMIEGAVEQTIERPKKRFSSLLYYLITRKRIDKKKREKGNNPYGRKGVAKCIPCRKWNIKVRSLHTV